MKSLFQIMLQCIFDAPHLASTAVALLWQDLLNSDTAAAALLQAFFVSILFFHNHNSMAYVHNTIVYPLEPPAGWLHSTSRTTVRAFTIKNAAGEAVTRAAVTATTTTTTLARSVDDADSSSTQQQHKGGRHPHPKHRLLSDAWGRSSAKSASQAPAKASTLPDGKRDIELQPQRVARVVEQSQQQGGVQEPTAVAEKYAVSIWADAPWPCSPQQPCHTAALPLA
jgi:hypothetical protein